MGYIEVKTSEKIYYFKCITFYKSDDKIEIQFFNGRQNEFMIFEKNSNIKLGLATCFMKTNNTNEYLKSVKKDNGDYLYLGYM